MDPFQGHLSNEKYLITISNFNYVNTLAVPYLCPSDDKWELELHSLTMSNDLDVAPSEEGDFRKVKEHLSDFAIQATQSNEKYDKWLTEAKRLLGTVNYEVVGKGHVKKWKKICPGSRETPEYKNKVPIAHSERKSIRI